MFRYLLVALVACACLFAAVSPATAQRNTVVGVNTLGVNACGVNACGVSTVLATPLTGTRFVSGFNRTVLVPANRFATVGVLGSPFVGGSFVNVGGFNQQAIFRAQGLNSFGLPFNNSTFVNVGAGAGRNLALNVNRGSGIGGGRNIQFSSSGGIGNRNIQFSSSRGGARVGSGARVVRVR